MINKSFKWLLNLLVVLLIAACTGSLEEEAEDEVASDDPRMKGEQLYNDNCLRCHLPLDRSEKKNRTVDQIKTAIRDVSEMQDLQLSDEDIGYISFVLETDAPDTPVVTIQDIMQLADVNCTSCHDASPGPAAVDLETGTLEDLARRLVNQPSANENCAGELLIDLAMPENSLLIKLIDVEAPTQCMSKMPFNTDGIPPQYMDDFRQWVDDIIAASANIDVPNPNQDTGVSLIPNDGFSVLSKAKTLLHGGAVTDLEYNSAIRADGSLNLTEYERLLDRWLESPENEARLFDFFALQLQQQSEYGADYMEQSLNLRFGGSESYMREMAWTLNETFVKTALRIVNDNEDLRNVVTTNEWEMTTGGLIAFRYLDGNFRRGFFDFWEIANANPAIFEDRHFNDWRTVRFEVSAEAPIITSAADLASTAVVAEYEAIADGDTMLLNAPRVGFFTSPAFFDKWPTNVDNQFRVMVNQMIITTLGDTFSAGDTTPVNHTEGLAEEHAPIGSDCRGCHQHIDPMRNAFTNWYGTDLQVTEFEDRTNFAIDFSFKGYKADGALETVQDFANVLSRHPKFGEAWVLKTCQWVSAVNCDPELAQVQQLVSQFEQSGYRFKPMVKALLLSELVTQRDANLESSWPGNFIGLKRQELFCGSMQAKLQQYRSELGFDDNEGRFDLCKTNGTIRTSAESVADDIMPRGELTVLKLTELDPFLHKSYNRLCDLIARSTTFRNTAVADGTHAISHEEDDAVIVDRVTRIIAGLPTAAPNHDEFKTSLANLLAFARKPQCTTEDEAASSFRNNGECGMGQNNLNSARTIVRAACLSPSNMAIGL